MDKEERYTLEILNRIEENCRVTQPEIANHLGISLGLANSFIKRIARKGYIKLTTIPRDRAKYLITPQGIAAKSRLTVKYLQYSLNFYKRAKETISGAYGQLHQKGIKTVVFYGAGEVAEIAYILLQQNQIKLSGVIDEALAGERFMKLRVGKLDDLKKLNFDKIIVTSIQPVKDVVKKIIAVGVPEYKVLLLDPLTTAINDNVSGKNLQPAPEEPA